MEHHTISGLCSGSFTLSLFNINHTVAMPAYSGYSFEELRWIRYSRHGGYKQTTIGIDSSWGTGLVTADMKNVAKVKNNIKT